ncbi:hypothetical protein HanIR_Chr09g0411881 [Helianthus annuus]|nr:hypothetical protein HanIR_Chr09g0411881 [Helianthus annuus]
MRTIECTTVYDKAQNVTLHEIRNRCNVVKTWWIRRWYFLYISVFTMLPNFRKRAMRNSVFYRPFRPVTNFRQLTNALYPIIHDMTSYLKHRFRLSTHIIIPIPAFVH